jgi:hypothetical protein
MKMWILVFLVSFAVISSADDQEDEKDIFSCLPDGQISRLAYTNFEKLDEAVDPEKLTEEFEFIATARWSLSI